MRLSINALNTCPVQGMIAIQHRSTDHESETVVRSIGNSFDYHLGQLYYTFLQGIQFNCNLPLGAMIIKDNIQIFVYKNEPKYMQYPCSNIEKAITAVKMLADA